VSISCRLLPTLERDARSLHRQRPILIETPAPLAGRRRSCSIALPGALARSKDPTKRECRQEEIEHVPVLTDAAG
jgi:hypothetical protein